MKAAVCDRYGPPEVVAIDDVPEPAPRPGELLVRVQTSTVNRTDVAMRAGQPAFGRPVTGLRRPRWRILGTEFAGEVVAPGGDVTEFRAGDSVFGINPWRFGTHAELVCVPAAGTVALRPESLSAVEAAAVCDGGLLALMNLRSARVRAGQRVAVYGASGSIGTAAVQLARALGAHVTALTAAATIDLVRGLGAEEAFDHTRVDIAEYRDAFDVIFDAVGKLTFARCRAALRHRGVYVPTDGLQNMFVALSHLRVRGRRAAMVLPPRYRRADVLDLKRLIESGLYRPVIDRSYPLDDVVAAHRYVDTAQKVGNVVLTIADA